MENGNLWHGNRCNSIKALSIQIWTEVYTANPLFKGGPGTAIFRSLVTLPGRSG
jgi:hypothetical protein